MGAISQTSQRGRAGVDIRCDVGVGRIVSKDGVRGVALDDGTFVEADVVVSNANPHHTFTELMDSASIWMEVNSSIACAKSTTSAAR